MADEPQSTPPQDKRRHRFVVWSLIVLASVLLVFSITANWVQRELLNTDEVKSTTDQILEDADVQQALADYTVEELYANVDVQAEIQKQLPESAQALAAPVTALTRQLALQVAERALASPRVQGLVTSGVGAAQEEFVRLVEDEGEFVSTTGGKVTLEYGQVIADLATNLGVDPSTVSQVQDAVQELSTDLQQQLDTTEGEIKSARSTLSDIEGGQLTSDQRTNLRKLQTSAATLQSSISSADKKLKSAQGSVPSQLKGTLKKLESVLSDLQGGLATVESRASAVLKDPSDSNAGKLDQTLGDVQKRLKTLESRQVVQTPGQLVLLSSSQLDGVQKLVGALRNLGFVLPLLVLLLYLGAIFLAKGWRRETLIAAGGGILVATLVVLVAKRMIGSEVGGLASSETVEPAVESVWDALADGLRERALFTLVIGVAFVVAGMVAGPGRHAVAVRRFLAPYLRDYPAAVYAVLAALFLVWLAFIPGINNFGQVLVILILLVLAVVGVELLRRQTAREFPR